MTRKEKQPFEEFLNQEVKVVYDDFGKPSVARGRLVSIADGFIFLIGHFSRRYIPISKINSMTLEMKE